MYGITHTNLFGTHAAADLTSSAISTEEGKTALQPSSRTLLLLLTASALMATYPGSWSTTTIALGLSNVALTALALSSFGPAQRDTANAKIDHVGQSTLRTPLVKGLRDVSAAAALISGVLALGLEDFAVRGRTQVGPPDQEGVQHWIPAQRMKPVSPIHILCLVCVHIVKNSMLLIMVSAHPTPDRSQKSVIAPCAVSSVHDL